MEQGRARASAAARPHASASVPMRVLGEQVPGGIPGQVRGEQARGEQLQGGQSGAEQARGEQGQGGQVGAEQVRGEQGQGGQVGAEQVRGEHTHSEPPAPGTVVRRHSVRGQILQALRAALVSGELRPGEVYSAPALGMRFGVSATPVREAMQQLALEGAVETVPNRGFRVTRRSARELAELAEVRALLEVPVMLRLARTVPAARWAELWPLAEATA
ncbi:GntR family transcriptional regulator, partial [Streptomyces sp. NPDC054841]